MAERVAACECTPLHAAPLRTSLPRGVPDALLTPNLRRQFVRKTSVPNWSQRHRGRVRNGWHTLSLFPSLSLSLPLPLFVSICNFYHILSYAHFANTDGTELTYTHCFAGSHYKPETTQVTLLAEPLKRYDAKRQILASFSRAPMAANVDLMPNIVLLQGYERLKCVVHWHSLNSAVLSM